MVPCVRDGQTVPPGNRESTPLRNAAGNTSSHVRWRTMLVGEGKMKNERRVPKALLLKSQYGRRQDIYTVHSEPRY